MSKAAALLAVLGVFASAFAPACSSDAVGIEACRKIETARCEATIACGKTAAESDYCVSFYQDQCLHGLTKPGTAPSDASVTACIDAIRVVATCADNGLKFMSQCPNVTLVASANPGATSPCTIINRSPELLSACVFLTPGVDAGSPVMPDASAEEDAGSDDAASDADAMIP